MHRRLSPTIAVATFLLCAPTFFAIPLLGSPSTIYAQEDASIAPDKDKLQEIIEEQSTRSEESFGQMLRGWKPANKVIDNEVNVKLWEFFRSTINWILVAGLIATALANILHLNIDTYGVKKILPGLLTGFLAANFSLFICKIILDIAESLTNTAFNVVQQATGFPLAGAMFGNSLPAVITAVIAVVVTFSFLPGLGTLLGIVIACLVVIAVLFFPIIAMVALILIFIVRNYIIQFLVVVAPVAFFLMGIPMGQGVFKKWWGLFTTWTFMKPIGLWLLTIGAIVMYSGVGGDFVGFIVGVASMFAAVTVPFSSGGQLMQQVMNNVKSAALSGRRMTTEGLSRFTENRGWGGRLSRSVITAMHAPEGLKRARDIRNQVNDAEGLKQASDVIRPRNERIERQYQNQKVAEHKKAFLEEGLNNDHVQLSRRLTEVQTDAERRALMDIAYENSMQHRVFRELQSNRAYDNFSREMGLQGLDTELGENRAFATARIIGGANAVDANGNVTSEVARRQLAQYQKHSRSNGFARDAAAIEQADGRMRINMNRTAPEQGRLMANMQSELRGTGNAREQAAKAKSHVWVRGGRLSDEVLYGLKNGTFDDMLSTEHIGHFDQSTKGEIRNARVSISRQMTTWNNEIRVLEQSNNLTRQNEGRRQRAAYRQFTQIILNG